MSDIFPDRNIVDEINSNRGSAAEHKIQYRIMQALESIAESLHEYMHPPVPKMSIPEPIRATAKVMEPLPISPHALWPSDDADRDSLSTTSEAVPITEEDRTGRRRRRQESA